MELYSFQDIEQWKFKYGSYKTFLHCSNCGYIEEVTIPKGFVISNKLTGTILINEETQLAFNKPIKCKNCEISRGLYVDVTGLDSTQIEERKQDES